jgi:hypothetical protein
LGFIYLSNDYGKTWTAASVPTACALSWTSVTSDSTGRYLVRSDDGLYVYAAVQYNIIFRSVNNGVWVYLTSAPSTEWNGITTDSIGQNVYAAAGSGGIYESFNHGDDWSMLSAPMYEYWLFIATDSTGKYVIASCQFDGTYLSSDYAVTWTQSMHPTPVNQYWFY